MPTDDGSLESDGSYAALQIATETPDRYLYVEYRSALGGALLTRSDSGDDYGGTGTYGNIMLVDGTPGTFSVTDAAVLAGSYITVDLGSSSSDSGVRMCAIHVASDTGRLSVEVAASTTVGPTTTPALTLPAQGASPTVESERCGDISVCCEKILYGGVAFYKVSAADDPDGYCCTEHCTYAPAGGNLYLHYTEYLSTYFVSDPGYHCLTEGSLSYWAQPDADFISDQCQ